MLQAHKGGDVLTPRAFDSLEKMQHEWWYPWRGGRRKLLRRIALVVGVLFVYACLLELKSNPCWLSASDCWRSAGAWSSSRGGEGSQSATGFAEPPTGLQDFVPTGLQHIVFGIAASASSWPRRQEYVKLWWLENSAMRGYVWLDGEVPSNNANGSNLPPTRISANVTQLTSAVRISRIVSESFRQNLSDVRWFVMGDDDTVFFPDNLVYLLRKYDHRRFFYIGHPSESQAQSALHSFSMAFGGGGFAISYALAERLAQTLDQCLTRYPQVYGSDSRIEACTAELGVPLTRERGFHQIDLRADIFGLLAAHPLAPLVSLHHVEAVAPIFPNRNAVEAIRHLLRFAVVDPLGLLQQSFCYDTNRNVTLSVSWGYAVQVFAGMRTPLELQKAALTFLDWRTWKAEANLFTFNVRALSRDPCENPSVFYMQDVQRGALEKNISISIFHQSNSWRGARCAKLPVSKEIKVLKERHSESWILAPRRQCCEVVQPSLNSWIGWIFPDATSIHLRVRQCKPNEVIAPPS